MYAKLGDYWNIGIQLGDVTKLGTVNDVDTRACLQHRTHRRVGSNTAKYQEETARERGRVNRAGISRQKRRGEYQVFLSAALHLVPAVLAVTLVALLKDAKNLPMLPFLHCTIKHHQVCTCLEATRTASG